MKEYLLYKSDGKLWPAGNTVWGLCSAWNFATNPSIYLSDQDHIRAQKYARAIKNRMKKLGFRYGAHYMELSNGTLWPKVEHVS